MSAEILPALPPGKASQSRGARPEDVLAHAERAAGLSIAKIIERAGYVSPIDALELRHHTDQARRYNEARLADFPDSAVIARLADAARKGLAVQTPAIIAREVATLVAAFPNAALPQPEIFIATATHDLLDLGIPDAVAVLACRTLRRTKKFVPAISEIVAAAQLLLADWQAVVNLPEAAAAARRQLAENAEKIKAELASQALERQRWAERVKPDSELWRGGAKPNPEKARAICCFPSLMATWRDDPKMLEVLGRADFELQQRASSILASRGEPEARAYLCRKLGAEP
jgi:hypothetical protein